MPALAGLVALIPTLCAGAGPAWPAADPAAVERWRGLRFGMFIHWGPVSLTGREIGWARGAGIPVEVYDGLYKRFNPVQFNADDWVSTAKAAGMRYIILTTKHHDGFCLWDTKLTDFNIMNSPFGRDVVKELAAACKKQGIAFGTYYSTCDWRHPDFPLTSPGGRVKRATSNLDAYNRYLLGQISELITNYGPLLTIWNDVPQMFEGRGANTIKMGRALQPDILFNNRTGDGGDYDTPEQRIGKYQDTRLWESCMTLSSRNQWAWGGTNDGVKPLAACLEMLIRGAGGDGNVLLNVGPTPEGLIPADQQARLREMGAWLARNGESIYGTRGGPWKPASSMVTTRKGNFVYVHLMRAAGGRVELPALPRALKSAARLGGGAVEAAQENGKIILTLDPAGLDPVDTVVRLEFDGPVMDIPASALAGAAAVKAAASNVYRKQTGEYGPQEAFDNDPDTRWATDSGVKAAWITAEFAKARTVGRVRIQEAIAQRVRQFEFQYREGQAWRTVFAGQTIGPSFQKQFEPVSAREFRLNILESTDGPTLSEIELLER